MGRVSASYHWLLWVIIVDAADHHIILLAKLHHLFSWAPVGGSVRALPSSQDLHRLLLFLLLVCSLTISMPITFGSVGDIIQLGLLVKAALQTIKDSRGASVEYQKTIVEIDNLTAILRRIQVIFNEYAAHANISTDDPIVRLAVVNLEQCYTRMSEFEKGIAPYQDVLGKSSKMRWFKLHATKLKWQFFEADCLPQFRRGLQNHCTFINMLLSGFGA